MRFFVFALNKKRLSQGRPWTFLLLIFSTVVMVGCSSHVRYSLLQFFFDGVPPLEKATISDSLEKVKPKPEAQIDSTKIQASTWFFHPSQGEGECKTCHDRTKSFRLIAESETLCLTCHDQASGEFVHAPVEAGECTICHNPHGTQNPNLLVMDGQELCFQCHDKEEVQVAEAHDGIEEIVCYDCHDPHNADDESLLK